MEIPGNILSQSLALPDSVNTNIEKGMSSTLQTALSIAQEHGNDVTMLTSLRETMLNFVKMDIQTQQYKTAAEAIRRKIEGKMITEKYSKHLKDELKLVQTRGAKEDPKQHEKYVDFEERLQAAIGANEPEEEEAEESAAMQIDGDLIMTHDVQSTKCPYTQQEMQNPVKNKRCGHMYDREGIATLIKHRGAKARCPIGGCPNKHALVEKDLIPDNELRAFILRKNSQRAN